MLLNHFFLIEKKKHDASDGRTRYPLKPYKDHTSTVLSPLLTALIQQCHNVVGKITFTDSKGKSLRGKNQYILKKFFFFFLRIQRSKH